MIIDDPREQDPDTDTADDAAGDEEPVLALREEGGQEDEADEQRDPATDVGHELCEQEEHADADDHDAGHQPAPVPAQGAAGGPAAGGEPTGEVAPRCRGPEQAEAATAVGPAVAGRRDVGAEARSLRGALMATDPAMEA